jgi:hypothetical protein
MILRKWWNKILIAPLLQAKENWTNNYIFRVEIDEPE